MASPLTVVRNDYHTNKKSSTIYTPEGVAKFLFDILEPVLWYWRPMKDATGFTVFDPAIGSGRLTDPWMRAGCKIVGCDVNLDSSPVIHAFLKGKFENCEWPDNFPRPNLVLCNPPFNGAPGKRLYPEVFLEKIFALFGVTTPIVMFAPMGFRLNQRRKSKRWRWLRDCGAEITSIISLPLDTFEGVEFHVEILVFNVAGLKAHYFLPEAALTHG